MRMASFFEKKCFSSECSSRYVEWTFENKEQSFLLETLIVSAQSPRILKKSKCRIWNFSKNSSTVAVYSLDKPAVFFLGFFQNKQQMFGNDHGLMVFLKEKFSRKVLLDKQKGEVTFLSATNSPNTRRLSHSRCEKISQIWFFWLSFS